MLCTSPIIYLSMILAREYNSDLGVDHWTTVEIILRYLNRTKEMFLSYCRGFVTADVLVKGLSRGAIATG